MRSIAHKMKLGIHPSLAHQGKRLEPAVNALFGAKSGDGEETLSSLGFELEHGNRFDVHTTATKQKILPLIGRNQPHRLRARIARDTNDEIRLFHLCGKERASVAIKLAHAVHSEAIAKSEMLRGEQSDDGRRIGKMVVEMPRPLRFELSR